MIKKRILHITEAPGGVERYLVTLLTKMKKYDDEFEHILVCSDLYDAEKFAGLAASVEHVDSLQHKITAGSDIPSIRTVRKLIKKDCDVVCVNLVDRTEPTVISELGEKNDVPIIYFNRELVAEDLERWDQLYYVGADAFQSGILEGEIAADAFLNNPSADKNGDGIFQYIMLEGEAGHQDAIVRTEYSVNTMIEKGVRVEKLGYAIANWNRAQAKTQTTAMLGEYGSSIELIMSNNDAMALGAIDALETENIPRTEWPVIVGIDGIAEGLEAVQEGKMAGTVYNDKEGQGRNMLRLAYALAAGRSLDDLPMTDGRYIRLPYRKILPGTAD